MQLRTHVRTIGAFAGSLAVIGVAGYASWEHIVHLARAANERPEVSVVLPFSVDGMMIVAAAMMAHDRANGRLPRRSARNAFLLGVVATVAANIASAHPPVGLAWGIGGRLIAAWPAIALLAVVEMIYRRGRVEASKTAPKPEAPASDDYARWTIEMNDNPVPVSPAPAPGPWAEPPRPAPVVAAERHAVPAPTDDVTPAPEAAEAATGRRRGQPLTDLVTLALRELDPAQHDARAIAAHLGRPQSERQINRILSGIWATA